MAVGERRSSAATWLVMGAIFLAAAYFVWKDPEGAWQHLRSIRDSIADFFRRF